MTDVWSDDPDRTVRRGDTRTPEQITSETFGQRTTEHWCECPWAITSHSQDRVTVYRGSEAEVWCGYHASMI